MQSRDRVSSQATGSYTREFSINLKKVWGPHNVDLFAARHNTQLPRYFSFKPDPEAEAVDALAQCWSDLRAYAFPHLLWYREMPSEVGAGAGERIVPVWHNQTRFPTLLTKLIDLPILLPDLKKIIPNPAGEAHPLIVRNSLHLAACRVSGQAYRNKEFQMSLSESFQQHGGKALKNLIHQYGESVHFGAVEQTPIPFQHLSGLFWTFWPSSFRKANSILPSIHIDQLFQPLFTTLMGDQLGDIQSFVVCCRGCSTSAPQLPDTSRYRMYHW